MNRPHSNERFFYGDWKTRGQRRSRIGTRELNQTLHDWPDCYAAYIVARLILILANLAQFMALGVNE